MLRTRAGAYAWIQQGNRVLLSLFEGRELTTGATIRQWTLPGGGMDYGEQSVDTVVREVREETAYEVGVGELLGVRSLYLPASERYDGGPEDLHSIQVVYAAEVIAGDLCCETEGSTVDVRWWDLDAIDTLDRVSLVDAARAFAVGEPDPGPEVVVRRV
jgi:8-oxo-dGTP diphosphatase